jgi:uncharacterized protein (TIGR03435 family)
MRNHFTRTGSGGKLFLMAMLAALMGAACVAVGLAQSSDWQIAAGGRMRFDTASVKQNAPGTRLQTGSIFPLGPGDVYVPTQGLFRAGNQPLLAYIAFAYKVSENEEQSLLTQLPKWATTARFDIQGKVQGNPTKDQMRLMMQALLEDRFRLAVHHEIRKVPVFALIVEQPGKLGPLLQRHPDGTSCATTPQVPSPPPTAPPELRDTRFPATCGGIVGMAPSAPGRRRAGARNVSMELISSSLTGGEGVDRPVLDRTNLTGMFDFAVEFSPLPTGPSRPGPNPQRDPTGPTFVLALREQLGLTLEPQTAEMDFLVIDHVEEPLAN